MKTLYKYAAKISKTGSKLHAKRIYYAADAAFVTNSHMVLVKTDYPSPVEKVEDSKTGETLGVPMISYKRFIPQDYTFVGTIDKKKLDLLTKYTKFMIDAKKIEKNYPKTTLSISDNELHFKTDYHIFKSGFSCPCKVISGSQDVGGYIDALYLNIALSYLKDIGSDEVTIKIKGYDYCIIVALETRNALCLIMGIFNKGKVGNK